MATRTPPPPPPPTTLGAAPALEELASGQRLIIYAILVNIAAVAVRMAVGNEWTVVAPVALVAAVLAINGLLRLASGLGYSPVHKLGLIVLAFVPLLSLVMLAMLSDRATKRLRAAGYRVGLFGASPRRGS